MSGVQGPGVLGGGGGSGGAPTDAEYALAVANAFLPNARVLTDSLGILWDFTTPGQVSATLTQAAITQAQVLARGLGA
jgi:hypothetical protein